MIMQLTNRGPLNALTVSVAANAVPVPSFTDQTTNDDELLSLLPLLEMLVHMTDVRSILGCGLHCENKQ